MGTAPARTADDVPARVVELLRAALGDAVSVDHRVLAATQADKSGHLSSAPPLAVVTAVSSEQVQATLRIANETSTPVVTRGAGTGLAGGAIAGHGEIVLSTLAMNSILEVSVDDELAVVQPGIINAELNRHLEPHGLWFAPDPASRAISTVGGNIATNAGGLLCAKYGVTRDAVLGLTVVLADGRELRMGRRTVKGVTGYDLTALMIGSEGTLGVIVDATVKLRRIELAPRATVSASFATVEAAATAAAMIGAAGIKPSIMELIGESAMSILAEYLKITDPGGSQLIVQTDGPAAEREANDALAVIRSIGGRAELSMDAAEGERLFAIRRAFHPALESRGTVLIEDVCVPRSALPAMFEALGEIEQRYGLVIPTVAHASDGNLHPNFVYEGDEVPAAIWAAADQVFVAALRLGGTLTGEHGIGLLKRRWIGDELGDDQLELQRNIKAVFDPNGILNPGKVF
jgi:glycolate oxidase